MANAETIYVDPSALRSSYLHDERSARFCAWRRKVGGALPITRFGQAELVNAIMLAAFRGDVEHDAVRAIVDDVATDLREGGLVVVEGLWRRTLDLATDLSARHTSRLGTRSLDVLHVATARVLEMKQLVTYDKRQAALARATGLKVLAP